VVLSSSVPVEDIGPTSVVLSDSEQGTVTVNVSTMVSVVPELEIRRVTIETG
jgi:hypothetical protein